MADDLACPPAPDDRRLPGLARGLGIVVDALAGAAGRAPDPDLALRGLEDLLDLGSPSVNPSSAETEALLFLLGGSPYLARQFLQRSDPLAWLRGAVVGGQGRSPSDLHAPAPAIDRAEAVELAQLRQCDPGDLAAQQRLLRAYRGRRYLELGARDLWGLTPIEETLAAVSRTAEEAVAAATDAARRAIESDHGPLLLESGRRNRFVVFGMGKLGAGELNCSSDVDLIFAYESDGPPSSGGSREGIAPREYFTRLAERLTRLVGDVTADGFVFRVDLRLRPDGMNGPLVNSLGATLGYYEALGQTWERAALFKARPVGGDLDLGHELLRELEPFVYRRTLDYSMIADLESMKARVEEQVHRAGRGERHVKLGPGGIREVEFLVQSFGMVHGGRIKALREKSTPGLLERLAQTGQMDPADAARLLAAWRWLRRVEHVLQMEQDRQTHLLPSEPAERERVARRLGLHLTGDGPIWQRRPIAGALERFEAAHTQYTGDVRHDFGALFRQRREETLGAGDAEVRALIDELDGPDAEARVARLGFADPPRALEALLTIRDGSPHARGGADRRRVLRQLAPALVSAARETAAPDRAISRLADFLGSVGARRTFLALLAENHGALKLLIDLFATSEYLSRELIAHPELLDALVRSDLVEPSKSRERLDLELRERLAEAEDFEEKLDRLRRFRNDEFLRIGIGDIQGLLHYTEVSRQLADLAEACLEHAYDVALEERSKRYLPPPGFELGVIAMGKLGSRELNYHSDLDLIFVWGESGQATSPSDEVVADERSALEPQEFFSKVAQLLMMVVQLATREGIVYKIDTRLRPSGRAGPLVTSLEGFARYHETSSAIWERQALIRARVVVGSPTLVARVEEIVDRFVFGQPASDADLAEIARIRARMEVELAHEDAGHFNLKLGRGGLVDLEFLAQGLALVHGHDRPALRRRGTRELLVALGECGILAPGELRVAAGAHSFLRGLENRLRIEGDQPIERVPRDPAVLARAARRMGYAGDGVAGGEALLADYARIREDVRAVYWRHVGRHAEESRGQE